MNHFSSRNGLWQHRYFMRLWSGQTLSMFGSMVSNIAIPFAAIMEMDDTPFDMAALRVAQVLNFSTSVFGAEFLLFVTIELEFQPGVPGLMFAVGGVTSLLGAVIGERVIDGLGPRRTPLRPGA